MGEREEAHFDDLPDGTKKFLQGLRDDEISLLAEAINFMRSVKTVGRFVKWLILIAVGTFMGAVTLGESIGKVRLWLGK